MSSFGEVDPPAARRSNMTILLIESRNSGVNEYRLWGDAPLSTWTYTLLSNASAASALARSESRSLAVLRTAAMSFCALA